MTREDKELLLKDLCARLPYNVVINCTEDDDERTNFNCFFTGDMVKDIQNEVAMWNIKPYLHPMSSMTEEERSDLFMHVLDGPIIYDENENIIVGFECNTFEQFASLENWLNSHHFDYRGLIEKGLALEAPEGMYKTE